MYHIKFIIKTEDPILISSNSGDANMVSTLDYIPGTVLSGIFAWKYIDKKKLDFKIAHEDDCFYRCFLNSGLCFSNAYILREYEHLTQYFYPTPISVQHEKNNEKKSYDLLANDIEEQTKITGKYCYIIGNKQLNIVSPDKSLIFHHNRNRENKDERERLIYNYESINQGQVFSGKITGSKEDIADFITNFNNSMQINIGRSKNIQYGKATIEFLSKEPEEFFSDIETFNQEIESEFILTLLSPAIIYNDNGFSTTSISDLRKQIAEIAGIPVENIDISESFIKSDVVENFVSIWRLKKPSETAFAAGSCFKVSLKNWDENIKKQLFELQKKGIGERRNEGFGRFTLNWQNLGVDEYIISDFNDKKSPELTGFPPTVVSNIIKKLIINEYQKHTEHIAFNECYEFCLEKKRIPSNSVLGRLELIIRNIEKPETFGSLIGNLRKTAKDKLMNCRNEKSNLFTYITENNPDIEQKIINQKHKLKEISAQIKYQPLEQKNELYKLYWITFLRLMRKKNSGSQ